MNRQLFLVLFLFGIQEAFGNPEEEVRKAAICLKKSGVGFDQVSRIVKGTFDEDPRVKEYLLCVSKNAGFQDRNGYLQRDVIRQVLKSGRYNEETIDEVLEGCTVERQTPQDTAFHFMRCVYETTFEKKYY